jgi:alpha-beta hydrolase superfamily lysophospholipase
MCPGSGAADRHNGSYFTSIGAHLLQQGCAVGSFDKRRGGASSGHWQDADIVQRAKDVLAVVGTVLTEVPATTPVGLFGHSQGGWVVLEAASRTQSVSFVITNSGPGVSPGEQMHYAARAEMTAAGSPQLRSTT